MQTTRLSSLRELRNYAQCLFVQLKNPGDVQLHVKLLRLFIRSRQVERAFEHAVQTEKTLAFLASSDWYECLLDVFQVSTTLSNVNNRLTCISVLLY